MSRSTKPWDSGFEQSDDVFNNEVVISRTPPLPSSSRQSGWTASNAGGRPPDVCLAQILEPFAARPGNLGFDREAGLRHLTSLMGGHFCWPTLHLGQGGHLAKQARASKVEVKGDEDMVPGSFISNQPFLKRMPAEGGWNRDEFIWLLSIKLSFVDKVPMPNEKPRLLFIYLFFATKNLLSIQTFHMVSPRTTHPPTHMCYFEAETKH
jgi:hypothetical protein